MPWSWFLLPAPRRQGPQELQLLVVPLLLQALRGQQPKPARSR
jgi:hypothetical protein